LADPFGWQTCDKIGRLHNCRGKEFGGFSISPFRSENYFSLSLSPFTLNYSTGSSAVILMIKYNNADLDKLQRLRENKGKCGVYR